MSRNIIFSSLSRTTRAATAEARLRCKNLAILQRNIPRPITHRRPFHILGPRLSLSKDLEDSNKASTLPLKEIKYAEPIPAEDGEGEKRAQGEAEQPQKSRSLLPNLLAAVFILALVSGSLDDLIESTSFLGFGTPPEILRTKTFSSFKIIDRQQVSPTAFIITVESPTPPSSTEVLRKAWQHGVFSAEIKQPQIQVARDYTPLPAATKQEEEEMISKGQMRFLIRRYDKGEVSTYLSRLSAGQTVEIRGPKLGFNIPERLGEEGDEIVFLAGGTGIVPALQVAKMALADANKISRMSVVWANRTREECSSTHPVTQLLDSLREIHKERFNYVCTVDAEKSFIEEKTITSQVQPSQSASLTTLPKNNCFYHSRTKLITSDGEDARWEDENCSGKQEKYKPVENCSCAADNKGGRNLLMISGPEGFIQRLAGAKAWSFGKERQGVVDGVVGGLVRKYPAFAEQWLVLKM